MDKRFGLYIYPTQLDKREGMGFIEPLIKENIGIIDYQIEGDPDSGIEVYFDTEEDMKTGSRNLDRVGIRNAFGEDCFV